MTSAVQHTMTRRLTAWLAALTVMLAPLTVHQAWAQDALAQARQHYTEGKGLFDAGDYQGAIREFETANRLAPSPILEFNIGLAYERLGNKPEALRRYRAYLQAMPNANNRGTVEAKIRRLEAELDATRTVQGSDGGEPAFPPPGPQAGGAGQTGSQAGQAGQEGQAGQAGTSGPDGKVDPLAGVRAGNPLDRRTTAGGGGESVAVGRPGATAGGGEVATRPGPAEAAQPSPPRTSTGDPMLDRVATVDVAAIRDQRAHLLHRPAPSEGGDEEEAEPVYKQVWFWVVVGVSAIILLDIGASDADDSGSFSTPTRRPALLRF